MGHIEDKYISLLTDFGFKRIFGTAPNKDLLISFLNTLFDGEQVIKDIRYLNSENVGGVQSERKAIFDVYCENEKGEKFIVEMQNAYQANFKARSLYYPIREQAEKGDWDFHLEHVYTVALLNFNMNDPAFDDKEIQHRVQLCDTCTKRVFYDKLTFLFVEIAKFDKTEDELRTMRDKWYFVLKNLQRLTRQPKALQERVFQKLFEEASIARFDPKMLKEYEDSLSAYRDIKNSINTATAKGVEEGMAKGLEEGLAKGLAKGLAEGMAKGMTKGLAEGMTKGREQGRDERSMEIARELLAMNIPIEQVAKATGLDVELLIHHCR